MSSATSMSEQTLDQLQRAAFGYFLQPVLRKEMKKR
jgi:hypothetical protein